MQTTLVIGTVAGIMAASDDQGRTEFQSQTSITCSEDATPCAAAYAASGEGCCPFADGVCCSNRQTCCPTGTTCQLNGPYLTDCVTDSSSVPAKSVCKPGPQKPLSTSQKNVIVLGDSVSIGYTPVLAKALGDIALVQHSPYDVRDGGAEETAYGFQCLDYFIRGPDGSLLVPDALIFNFGLHDGPLGNATIPGQQGNSSVYADELEQIVLKLKSTYTGLKTKLVFALTSPMLCNPNADGNVVTLNNIAAAIMQQHGVMILDPHTAIIGECGPVPQSSCFGKVGCFCPHCAGEGYTWLSQNVFEPAFRTLLASDAIV